MPSIQFLFRARKSLAASTLAATGISGYLYWHYFSSRRSLHVGENPGDRFQVELKTERGMMRPTFGYLGTDVAEALLRRNESTRTFNPLGFKSSDGSTIRAVVTRFDNNWVDCNAVGEDRHVEDYFSKDILSKEKIAALAKEGNWNPFLNTDDASLKIFTVLDGHGGTDTADLLKDKLHFSIVSSLRCYLAGARPGSLDPLSAMRKCGGGTSAFLSSYAPFGYSEITGRGTAPEIPKEDQAKLNRDTISEALSSAFTNLDYEICVQPLRDLLNNPGSTEKIDYKDGPAPAVSGAGAVTVMVDEDSQDVYVAHTGDTRAVAGYWVAPETDSNGVDFAGGWRCEVLTADHIGKNPGEIKRLEQDHPGEENVLDHEYRRMWGALMPTRAFGDSAWYKWTDQETKDVIDRTENPTWWLKEPKPAYHASTHTTPPYLTAKPDVTIRSLESNKDFKGQLKFIIAATDGLWDLLSSEEAVGLVATHLAHPQQGPISHKAVLASLLDQRRASLELFPGPRLKEDALDGTWVYQDENAATHLIRNAFGASGAVKTAHQMLSLTPPLSRNFRDDVTCSVIFFDPPVTSGEKAQSPSERSEKHTGLLDNLLRRWNVSPIDKGPAGFEWKHPLTHI